MFEWDRNNLRKTRAHRINQEEVEWVLLNDPIPVHEQDVEGEHRFVYYGETGRARLLAVIVTDRRGKIRVTERTASSPRLRLAGCGGESDLMRWLAGAAARCWIAPTRARRASGPSPRTGA